MQKLLVIANRDAYVNSSVALVLAILCGACAGSVDTADSLTDRRLAPVDAHVVDVAGGRAGEVPIAAGLAGAGQ